MAPEIRWSSKSYTQTEFVIDRHLPSLVKLVSGKEGNPPENCLGPLVDVKKNFLVCSQRRRTKGYAQHMVWDPDKNSYMPDDLIIEIPKDYPGFFEIVPSDPRKTVTHMSSIQEVVTSSCTQFLVRTLTGGFRTKETPNGQLEISSKHMVYPGEVLYVIKTLTKHWKLMENGSNGKKRAESQYLQCIDSCGIEVCIPLMHPGIYCAFYDVDVHCSNFVWTMDDLLSKFDLPMTVRLSFGWPPKLPRSHHFTGVLTLFEKRRPDTLVLYNLKDNADVVVELPFDMKVNLQPAENYDELSKDEDFHRRSKDRDTAVYFYLVNMKSVSNNYRNILRSDARIDTVSRAGAQLTLGLAADAQDMKTFTSSDSFPPLKDPKTDSWGITFTDTTAEKDIYFENNPEKEEGRRNSVEEKLKTGLSRSKSLAGHTKTEALGKAAKGVQVPSPENTRRARINEMDRRETHC